MIEDSTIELPEMGTPEVELVEYIFTNDKTNPFAKQILHLVYDAAFKNLIGVMQAKHKPTNMIHTLLVGLERSEDGGVNTYPLARILSQEEQSEYLAPDGHGNYPEE